MLEKRCVSVVAQCLEKGYDGRAACCQCTATCASLRLALITAIAQAHDALLGRLHNVLNNNCHVFGPEFAEACYAVVPLRAVGLLHMAALGAGQLELGLQGVCVLLEVGKEGVVWLGHVCMHLWQERIFLATVLHLLSHMCYP